MKQEIQYLLEMEKDYSRLYPISEESKKRNKEILRKFAAKSPCHRGVTHKECY